MQTIDVMRDMGCKVGCACAFPEMLRQSYEIGREVAALEPIRSRKFPRGERRSMVARRLWFGMSAWMDVGRVVRKIERRVGERAGLVYFNMIDEYLQTFLPQNAVRWMLGRNGAESWFGRRAACRSFKTTPRGSDPALQGGLPNPRLSRRWMKSRAGDCRC